MNLADILEQIGSTSSIGWYVHHLEISGGGKTVTVHCLDEAFADNMITLRRFRLVYNDCSNVRLEMDSDPAPDDPPVYLFGTSNIVDFQPGKDHCQEPAWFLTNSGSFGATYGSVILQMDGTPETFPYR